jgi:hypothetical protein
MAASIEIKDFLWGDRQPLESFRENPIPVVTGSFHLNPEARPLKTRADIMDFLLEVNTNVETRLHQSKLLTQFNRLLTPVSMLGSFDPKTKSYVRIQNGETFLDRLYQNNLNIAEYAILHSNSIMVGLVERYFKLPLTEKLDELLLNADLIMVRLPAYIQLDDLDLFMRNMGSSLSNPDVLNRVLVHAAEVGQMNIFEYICQDLTHVINFSQVPIVQIITLGHASGCAKAILQCLRPHLGTMAEASDIDLNRAIYEAVSESDYDLAFDLAELHPEKYIPYIYVKSSYRTFPLSVLTEKLSTMSKFIVDKLLTDHPELVKTVTRSSNDDDLIAWIAERFEKSS